MSRVRARAGSSSEKGCWSEWKEPSEWEERLSLVDWAI